MKTLNAISIAAVIALAVPATAHATSAPPAPIEALAEHGFKIEQTFEVPGDMTGYVAEYKGRPITIYLTADHKRAIVGTMIDAKGRNVGAEALRHVSAQQYQGIWPRLEKSSWVADGSDDAERVIYAFTDANCPFCHKFWQKSRPWVKAGKVQIREIMIGVLKPSSPAKAAAILAADDSAAALEKNERHFDDGGIAPLDKAPLIVKKLVKDNNSLMRSLGFYGTPTIVYHDADGNVRVIQGLPQGDKMAEVMGSAEP